MLIQIRGVVMIGQGGGVCEEEEEEE